MLECCHKYIEHSQWENWNYLFCLKCSFLTGPHCQYLGVGQVITKGVISPNMCSNIPASPAYDVYISQLIRYARASSNYSDYLKRHLHLRNRLPDQDYKKIRLIRSLKKFIFRFINVWRKSVFDIYIHWIWYCFDNYFTYFVPVFKYCYSDSRSLWTVMRAGGLAL
jgi:hypothetical protein